LNVAQAIARGVLQVLDVPIRWAMHFADAVIGDRGYFAVGTLLAVGLALYGLFDTKATQEETHASVERSIFMTLVSSGNAASFVAAMKEFGPIQTMPVTRHPWFEFWEWGRTYPPNRDPMWRWAVERLRLCGDKNAKDCSLDDARIDLRFADLSGAYLTHANLSGATLRRADLSGADLNLAVLNGADLTDADLRLADLTGADLKGADLSGAKLSGAHLTGADLSFAKDVQQQQLDHACGIDAKLPPGMTLRPCE
jgi:hypothetical protein